MSKSKSKVTKAIKQSIAENKPAAPAPDPAAQAAHSAAKDGTAVAANTNPLPVAMIAPEELYVAKDPKHPLFDRRALLPADELLVDSIAAVGMHEPILVREGTVGGKTRFEVIDGRRRVAALLVVNERRQAAKKEPMKALCVIESKKAAENDADAFGITVLANELRADDTVMARAEKAQRLLDAGTSKPRAAMLFGVTTATINNWIKLLSSTKKVREAVEAGKIAPTAAFKLAVLDPKEQDAALAELLGDGEDGEKVKGSSRAAAESASKRNERAQGTRRPSARQLGVLRDTFAETLKMLGEKDELRSEIEACVEVLDYALTGEQGDFVDLALSGSLAKATKPKATAS